MDNNLMPEAETVVDYLLQMFPGSVDRDVIAAVVESCAGDLDHSTDALLTIISGNQSTNSDAMASNEQPSTSYADASKKVSVVKQNNENTYSIEEDGKGCQNREQLKNIIYYYNKGYKYLILMRGLPGCGKSYLAKLIIDKTVGPSSLDYKKHVLSTDDFFVDKRGYSYDKFSIPQAHNWNQDRVRQAIKSGLSPIIVDNTNIELWEMEVYVREAVREGYIVEILEPQTLWARNVHELAKRNTHGVPLNKIKMMAEKYERHVTTSSVMKTYKIAYPANKDTPQKRSLPVFKENFTDDNLSSTVTEQPAQINVMKPQITEAEQTTTPTTSKRTIVKKPMLNNNLELPVFKDDCTHDSMSSKITEQPAKINAMKPQITQTEQTTTATTSKRTIVKKPMLKNNLELPVFKDDCTHDSMSSTGTEQPAKINAMKPQITQTEQTTTATTSKRTLVKKPMLNNNFELPVFKDDCTHDSMSSSVTEQPAKINAMKPQITQREQTTTATTSKHATVNKSTLNDNLESCIENCIGSAHLSLDKTTSRHNGDLAGCYSKHDDPNDANPRPGDQCTNTDSSRVKYKMIEGILPLSRDSSIEELMIFSKSEPWEVEAERKSNELYETFEVIEPQSKKLYTKKERNDTENMLPSEVDEWDEWDSLTKYVPSWDIQLPLTSIVIPTRTVVTVEKQTSVEQNDFKNDNLKCLIAVSRDINIDHNFREEIEIKIPKTLMVDKSSFTHQRTSLLVKATSEDIHYRENILNENILNMCDGCDGCNNDVELSINFFIDNNTNGVEIHLDSKPEILNETYNSHCICVLNFIRHLHTLLTNANKIKNNTDTTSPSQQQRKRRRWKNSAAGSKLKEEIEKNFVINRYSKHMQLIKTNSVQHNDHTNTKTEHEVQYGTNAENVVNNIKCRHHSDTSASDISTNHISFEDIDAQETRNNGTPREESVDTTPEVSVSGDDTSEENVSVILGNEFVKNIDDKFGRSNFIYPIDIQPVVAMSKSMLDEINALWVESLSHQLSCMSISPEVLQKEDEDLARALSLMEEEYVVNGIEAGVPDLADIMDMESALHLQNEACADVRNYVPNDMASKMTRDKLYNLFPDQDRDDLLEVFSAHDNNFLDTVEVLLTSMGRGDIVEEENGVKKFIYKAELERQSKNLAVERQKAEWPQLSQPIGSRATDLAPFDRYRSKADEHLKVRNQNMMKAREVGRRGMTGIADYYKSVAVYHGSKYQQANCLAISSIVNQIDAAKNTIDLHYMYVQEALACLDVVLDGHIQDLRAGPKNRTEGVTVFAITGRGLHSAGRAPRIKPAVLDRFLERDLEPFELNPGLLGVFVYANSLLSDEVNKLLKQARLTGGNVSQKMADFKKTL